MALRTSCPGPTQCEYASYPVCIEVDTDIVGLGVILSFLLTAIIATGMVLIGYMRNLIPGDLLTPFDKAFLKRLVNCKACSEREQLLSRPDSLAKVKSCHHVDGQLAIQRSKGFVTFMLALSDGQLITGLAISVGAWAQYSAISVYEALVVSSLAWLSATTHLATLLALRGYFYENRAMRLTRAILMGATFLLVLITNFLSFMSTADVSARFVCVFSTDFNYLLIIVLALGLCRFTWSFFAGLTCIFPGASTFWDRQLFRILRYRLCKSGSGPHMSEQDFSVWYASEITGSSYNNITTEYSLRQWSRWRKAKEDKKSYVQRFFLKSRMVTTDYSLSILSEIPSLLYHLAYGVTGVFYNRFSTLRKPTISNPENAIDFGQIVPAFLLLLPILSAIETWFDIHQNINHNEDLPISNSSIQRAISCQDTELNDILIGTSASLHTSSMPADAASRTRNEDPIMDDAIDERIQYLGSSGFTKIMLIMFILEASILITTGVLIPLMEYWPYAFAAFLLSLLRPAFTAGARIVFVLKICCKAFRVNAHNLPTHVTTASQSTVVGRPNSSVGNSSTIPLDRIKQSIPLDSMEASPSPQPIQVQSDVDPSADRLSVRRRTTLRLGNEEDEDSNAHNIQA